MSAPVSTKRVPLPDLKWLLLIITRGPRLPPSTRRAPILALNLGCDSSAIDGNGSATRRFVEPSARLKTLYLFSVGLLGLG